MTRACPLRDPGHSSPRQGTGWRCSAAAASGRHRAAGAGRVGLLQVGFQPRESSTPLHGACQWFFASSQGCQPPPLSSSCCLCHLKGKPLCRPGTHRCLSYPWVCPCWTFPRDGIPWGAWCLASCLASCFQGPSTLWQLSVLPSFYVPVMFRCVDPACSLCPREALQGLSCPRHWGPLVSTARRLYDLRGGNAGSVFDRFSCSCQMSLHFYLRHRTRSQFLPRESGKGQM